MRIARDLQKDLLLFSLNEVTQSFVCGGLGLSAGTRRQTKGSLIEDLPDTSHDNLMIKLFRGMGMRRKVIRTGFTQLPTDVALEIKTFRGSYGAPFVFTMKGPGKRDYHVFIVVYDDKSSLTGMSYQAYEYEKYARNVVRDLTKRRIQHVVFKVKTDCEPYTMFGRESNLIHQHRLRTKGLFER